MTSRLHFDHAVTLIGGGEVRPADLSLARGFAPGLVAADGGAAHALKHGLLPDAVIGDFDSFTADLQAQFPPDRLIRVAEQDTTDFEKSLTRLAAPFVIGIGFLGRRQDHALAALSVMARQVGPPVILLGESDIIFAAGRRLSLDLGLGVRVSLFPMGAVRASSQGLRWPLDGIGFAPDGRIATSNETTGPLRLSVDGPLLVILPQEMLGRVIRQHFSPEP